MLSFLVSLRQFYLLYLFIYLFIFDLVFSLFVRMANQDGVAFIEHCISAILQLLVSFSSSVLLSLWKTWNLEHLLIYYQDLLCRLLRKIIQVGYRVLAYNFHCFLQVKTINLFLCMISCVSLVATEVFSWGSGVNYQLGTGNAHIQKLPCKVDSLHGSVVKLISAAKFHSVAVTSRGEVYTWGFGRGGRLGHPDFDIHR